MFALAGCQSSAPIKSVKVQQYDSPQELISKRNLNQADGSAKDYIYLWDAKNKNNDPQALIPRTTISQYCHAKGGVLVLSYKSQLRSVANATQKKRLSNAPHLSQGIGAYKCKFNGGNYWMVSIEPISEQLLEKGSTTRSVKLLTKVVTMTEARQYYRGATVLDKKVEAAKTPTKPNVKEVAKKEAALKENLKEPVPKEVKPVEVAVPIVIPNTNIAETAQQQQARLYVAARRDINAGRNINNACNNAHRAYGLGKQQGTEGTRVYTESGMLVARCLNNIPSYGSRIPNAKGQAKRILTNLANNYNHSGAKNMLRQMK